MEIITKRLYYIIWKDYYNREEDTMSRENFWRRDEGPEEKRQNWPPIYRYNIIFPNSSLHRKQSEDIVLKYPKKRI